MSISSRAAAPGYVLHAWVVALQLGVGLSSVRDEDGASRDVDRVGVPPAVLHRRETAARRRRDASAPLANAWTMAIL